MYRASGARRREGSRGQLKAPAPTTPELSRSNGTVTQEAEIVKLLRELIEVQQGLLEVHTRLAKRLEQINYTMGAIINYGIPVAK